VTALVCVAGWLAAVALALELRRRARLIRDAGHELRGPLGALSLGLETLRRQPVVRARAEALLTELMRAEAAADDVAEAARGRRASESRETVRLERLVRQSAEAWAPSAERAGRSVRVDWPADATRVRADRRRLAQAFGNLLANAVEHGGGEVLVRGRPVGDAIRVEISDRGGGKAGGHRPRKGTRGRGLVIAERALRGAGGRLEARGAPGGGRVAVAELPLELGG